MVFVKDVFVVILVASLVGLLAFTVVNEYVNDDADLVMSDDMNTFNTKLDSYKQNSTDFATNLSTRYNTEESTILENTVRFITAGYNTFVSLLNQMFQVQDLILWMGTTLGIPSMVGNVLFAILILSLVITIALIVMRLGVF